MRDREVGDRIAWHIEGSFEDIEYGEVVLILKWPSFERVRAYGVKPDKSTIIFAIVKVGLVVEEVASEKTIAKLE